MKLIAVLGMHRSGTSAFTGLLSEMGVELGPEDGLLPPAEDNPAGFFENEELYQINRQLLHKFGGNWKSPPLLRPGWESDEIIEDERRRASVLLSQLAKRTDSWVAVKDPRLCLLVPFWENLYPVDLAFHVVRHPSNVASSLQKRDGMATETGLLLWLRYVSSAFRHHPEAIRIDYDELVENTPDVARRVATILGEHLSPALSNDGVVRADFRHNRETGTLDSEVSRLAVRIHNELTSGVDLSDETQELLRVLGDPAMSLINQRTMAENLRRSENLRGRLEKQYEAAQSKLTRTQTRLERLKEKQSLEIAKNKELRESLKAAQQQLRSTESSYKRLRRRRSVRLAVKGASLLSPAVRPLRELRRRTAKRREREELQSIASEPIPQPANPTPRVTSFDSKLASDAMRVIDARYEIDPERFDAVSVSVVLPTYNRRRLLPSAIKSVLNQSHQKWELIIVDDGSTDASRDAVAELIDDPRVRWISVDNGGVAAARNIGLKNASGDYVAYLDSDNRWHGEHLRAMVVALETTGATSGYTALNAESLDGEYLYTRGRDFDWRRYRETNYVDINVFVHRRDLLDKHEGFQAELGRMVGRELILRLTHGEKVQYVPVLGCRYRDYVSEHRISSVKPMAFDAILKTRIPDGGKPLPWTEVAKRVRLTFALKIPTPEQHKQESGEYPFAVSLSHALEHLGHDVRIDFLEDWETAPYADVNLVLRGLTPFEPVRGSLNVIWNHNYPEKIPIDEYAKFDLTYTASESYARLLQLWFEDAVEIRHLPWATDPRRVAPHPAPAGDIPHHQLLFVGNSRKEFRDIVRWAVDAGLEPAVYGTNWAEFLPDRLIEGSNIPNDELGAYYSAAEVVLNDHSPSMRDFGIVSNRVFDVLACGSRVVSDRTWALSRMFGSVVSQVASPRELKDAVGQAVDAELQQRASDYILSHHTLEQRAAVIVNDVLRRLGLDEVHPTVPHEKNVGMGSAADVEGPQNVGIVVTRGVDRSPQSSAFIRLMNPLTDDAIIDRVKLNDLDIRHPERTDISIVQRTSIPTLEEVDAFLSHHKRGSGRLIVDVDDAFLLIDESHPEYDAYRHRNEALETVLREADQAWFSTPTLAETYSHMSPDDVRVMENTLDPRFWRVYRQHSDPIPRRDGPVRLLYMGTATHDADFVLVRDALSRLADDFDFTLTLIGAVRHPPDDLPWLEVVKPPRGIGVYPRFVRWLRAQPSFDVGVSPLVPSKFNDAKSDIKFLDYSALGLISVLSEGSAYQGVIDKGLAIGAGPEGWVDALSSVLDDIDGHRRMAEAAKSYLWSERSSTQAALRMVQAFDDLKQRT